MSLLAIDSFDFYGTADLPATVALGRGRRGPGTLWSTASGAAISVGTGRRGTNSLRLDNAGAIEIAPGGDPKAVICGFAYRTDLAAAGSVWYLFDPVNVRNQVLVAQGVDGLLTAYRGGASPTPGDLTGATALGTSSTGLTANAYAYVEIFARLDPTAGSVVVHVDRVEVLRVEGANTVAVGGGYFTLLGLHGAGGGNDFDDAYICDPAGPAPWNDFLGDCLVTASRPIANGSHAEWRPVGGTNWSAVADPTPDGDATFNAASQVNALDTYAKQPAPSGLTTILGIQHTLVARKTDVATCVVAPVVRVAGVDFVNDRRFALDTAYRFSRQIQPVNPATGNLWTVADFNAAEFGVKRVG